MTSACVVTGTLTDARTLQLDEPLPITGGKVRVAAAAPAEQARQSPQDYLAELRRRQVARGHVPRSAAEIEARVREERDSWED